MFHRLRVIFLTSSIKSQIFYLMIGVAIISCSLSIFTFGFMSYDSFKQTFRNIKLYYLDMLRSNLNFLSFYFHRYIKNISFGKGLERYIYNAKNYSGRLNNTFFYYIPKLPVEHPANNVVRENLDNFTFPSFVLYTFSTKLRILLLGIMSF